MTGTVAASSTPAELTTAAVTGTTIATQTTPLRSSSRSRKRPRSRSSSPASSDSPHLTKRQKHFQERWVALQSLLLGGDGDDVWIERALKLHAAEPYLTDLGRVTLNLKISRDAEWARSYASYPEQEGCRKIMASMYFETLEYEMGELTVG